MPKDTRRLPVPDQSIPPEKLQSAGEVKGRVLIDEKSKKRADGRREADMRSLFMKTGVISQARGSAYIEIDKTKIICAVYGPREVTRREDFSMKGQLSCEVKFATFSSRFRLQHQADDQDKDLSLILQQALEPAVRLEKFPKSKMDIFVTVLQNDGGAIPGAITVSSLALADAGIDMYDIVLGCSLLRQEKIMLLDPTLNEERMKPEKSNTALMTIGFMPSLHQVAAVEMEGLMTTEATSECLHRCIEGCQQLYSIVQDCLVQSVKEKS